MWGHFTDCGFDRCGVPLKNYLGRLSECTPCCKLHQMEELCNTATSNLAKKSCSGSLVFVRKVLSNWKLKTCWCLWQIFLTVLESSWTQERAGSSVKLQPAAFFPRSLVPDNGEEQTFCYYFLLFYIPPMHKIPAGNGGKIYKWTISTTIWVFPYTSNANIFRHLIIIIINIYSAYGQYTMNSWPA